MTRQPIGAQYWDSLANQEPVSAWCGCEGRPVYICKVVRTQERRGDLAGAPRSHRKFWFLDSYKDKFLVDTHGQSDRSESPSGFRQNYIPATNSLKSKYSTIMHCWNPLIILLIYLLVKMWGHPLDSLPWHICSFWWLNNPYRERAKGKHNNKLFMSRNSTLEWSLNQNK